MTALVKPAVTFDGTDRGGQYLPKLQALAAAVDTAFEAYNMQVAAAETAEQISQATALLHQQTIELVEEAQGYVTQVYNAIGTAGNSAQFAAQLLTARTIAGVPFNGTQNINLTADNVGAMSKTATVVTDWNNALANGAFYSLTGAANVPKAAAGWQGFVSVLNSENIRQIVWSADGPSVEMYSRCGDGTTLVWGAWVSLRHSGDGLDNTDIVTTAATISRRGVITRASIVPASASVTITIAPSFYQSKDRIDLDVMVPAGRQLTLACTTTMAVANGTNGTSHTLTGPVCALISLIHNGTLWQLFIA